MGRVFLNLYKACWMLRNRLFLPGLLLMTLPLTQSAFATSSPKGNSANAWGMVASVFDGGSTCLPAFLAQTGLSGLGVEGYYASEEDAVADVMLAFPGQVKLYEIDPPNPALQLGVSYDYEIQGCTSGNNAFIFVFGVFYDTAAASIPASGPKNNNTPCPVSVNVTNPLPQYEQATFTVPSSYTLSSYATNCGFTAFDWQQQITNMPSGIHIVPNVPSNLPNNVYPSTCASQSVANWLASNSCSLVAGPSVDVANTTYPNLYDSPKGGLYYIGGSYDPYPFYYPISAMENGTEAGVCTMKDSSNCPSLFPYIVDKGNQTLAYLDAPNSPTLSGADPSQAQTGRYLGFSTALMGVYDPSKQTGTPPPGTQPCASDSSLMCTPLYRWKWTSTFNGTACSGAIGGKCGSGGISQTSIEYPVDSTSGTGGVNTVSLNGVPPSTATPTFNAPGGTYSSSQTVTISDSTPGAVIYYTTNGFSPSSRSTLYSGPITVDGNLQIQAFAVAPGLWPSGIGTANYTFLNLAPSQTVLTATPSTGAQGTVFTLQATITSNSAPITRGSVTFYDGSTPLGTVELNSSTGVATLKTASLTYGSNQLTAQFNQNNIDLKSASNQVTVTVTGKLQTATALTSSGSANKYALNASVNAFGLGTPTGSVTFNDLTSKSVLGTAVLSGPGTAFTGTGALTEPKGAEDIAIGDVNGDGYPDIVIASYNGSTNWLSVALGNGDGTFGTPQPVTTLATDNNGGSSIALADLNGDGALDIVAGSWAGLGVAVFLGNGDGTFGAEVDYTIDHSYANSIAVGDFNGDGKLDVVTSNPFGNSISVLLGNGDGTLQAAQSMAADTAPESVTVADLNNDGRLDIAVANTTGTASIFLGNGDGKFQPQSLITVSTNGHLQGPKAIVSADFNGDGNPDLAISIWDSQSVGVLLGKGDGTFQPVQLFSTPAATPTGVAVADINRDGKQDLVVSSYNGNIASVLMGDGTGSFKGFPVTVDDSSVSLALADLNGDGLIDLATVSATLNTVSLRLAASSFTGSIADVSFPNIGSDQIDAVYSGDSTFDGSTSNTLTLQGDLPLTAEPTFSPAGGKFTKTQTVNITDATVGAAIYYTTSGQTPTTASTRYTKPIAVSASLTIKAVALAEGHAASVVASAVFTVTPPAATPVIAPAGGKYTKTQTVRITDETGGAAIYYTTNGKTPTTTSTRYSKPIAVSTTETVKAIAIAPGHIESATASAEFTVTLPTAAPAFSPAGGKYSKAQTVKITDATTGATIYYTINGKTPTTASAKYTKPITVSATETIRAMAVASSHTQSAVVVESYTIVP